VTSPPRDQLDHPDLEQLRMRGIRTSEDLAAHDLGKMRRIGRAAAAAAFRRAAYLSCRREGRQFQTLACLKPPAPACAHLGRTPNPSNAPGRRRNSGHRANRRTGHGASIAFRLQGAMMTLFARRPEPWSRAPEQTAAAARARGRPRSAARAERSHSRFAARPRPAPQGSRDTTDRRHRVPGPRCTTARPVPLVIPIDLNGQKLDLIPIGDLADTVRKLRYARGRIGAESVETGATQPRRCRPRITLAHCQ